MPREWLYFIALLLPVALRAMVLHTGFVDWLWYNDYQDYYYLFAALKVHPQFLEFVGGWPLTVFIITVFIYWLSDDDEKDLGHQFLMLPIVFIPFSIIGTALVRQSFDSSTLYVHPLIVLPAGYIYVLLWALIVWAFVKLRVVV